MTNIATFKFGEWISVEDALPPIEVDEEGEDNLSKSVLLLTADFSYISGWLNFNRNEWYIDILGDFFRKSEITHWMPFPEDPKNEGMDKY